MISTSKDEQRRVIGYIEWRQVGQSGFDKLNGEYVWVNYMWIHEDYRGNKDIFRQLVNNILFMANDAKWCYFKKDKYNENMSKLYTRADFIRLSEKGSVALHG